MLKLSLSSCIPQAGYAFPTSVYDIVWVPKLFLLLGATTCLHFAAVECGSLTSPENGNVTLSGTNFTSIAQYTCNSGYVLMGVESRQCQADRTWSNESPMCEGMTIFTGSQ